MESHFGYTLHFYSFSFQNYIKSRIKYRDNSKLNKGKGNRKKSNFILYLPIIWMAISRRHIFLVNRKRTHVYGVRHNILVYFPKSKNRIMCKATNTKQCICVSEIRCFIPLEWSFTTAGSVNILKQITALMLCCV